MDKKFKTLIIKSLSLAMIATFAACSSDDFTESQITPNGEKAKTSFVVSLPFKNSNGGTRASAAVVQDQGTIAQFRGMDFMKLIPFAKDGAITSTDARIGQNINLPVAASGSNYMAADALTNQGSVKYDNVTIPIGTYSFLFYGKAIDATANTAITTDSAKHAYGILAADGLTESTPASISFNLVKIYPSVTDNAVRNALVAYVNAIAAAKVGDATGQRWYDSSNPALLSLYNEFVTLGLGSTAGVKNTVQDLYSSLWSNSDPLAVAICDSIKTKATDDPADGVLTFDAALGSGATAYPQSINLPEGAAALSWNDATPKVATANTTGSSNNVGFIVPKITDYVYPPSLYYRVNSTLKTASASQASSYVDDNDWATILAGYTGGTVVSTSTRSVAIKDPIQYAVGRLEATVQLGATNIYDHKGNEVTPNASGFPVTAVFIGEQRNVDFEFKPKAVDPMVVYDNAITGIFANSAAPSNKMHTLALETTSGSKVNVALELENNTGHDFYGYGGDIIKAGAKFYLAAELDPTLTDPAKISGNNATIDSRVYVQDYVTKAVFTIKAGVSGSTNTVGLGNAYSVIPDLASTTMELGMSVNLSWQSGITFNVGM